MLTPRGISVTYMRESNNSNCILFISSSNFDSHGFLLPGFARADKHSPRHVLLWRQLFFAAVWTFLCLFVNLDYKTLSSATLVRCAISLFKVFLWILQDCKLYNYSHQSRDQTIFHKKWMCRIKCEWTMPFLHQDRRWCYHSLALRTSIAKKDTF